MIDYHSKGNLMGVYGERMQGKPTARNFDFGETVTEIVATNEGVPTVLPVLPQSWRYFWRHGQWNELRAESLATHPLLPRGSMASSLWSLPTPRSGCQTQAASPCKYTAGATVRNSLCAIETFEQSRWIDPRKTRTADCVRLSHPQRAENSKQGIL